MTRTALHRLGAVGFLGVAAMAVTDVIGILARPDYRPLSETISLLAHHRLTGAQDIGLLLLAVGCAACGVGLFGWLPRGRSAVAIAVLLLLAAAATVVLTIADVMAGRISPALRIHIAASLAVGAILLVASSLLSFALPRARRAYRRYSAITAVVLAALAVLYPFVPPGWFGLYERVLVADGLAWLGMVSFALVRS